MRQFEFALVLAVNQNEIKKNYLFKFLIKDWLAKALSFSYDYILPSYRLEMYQQSYN